ncbi:MAG: hypothetical protein FJ041_00770 [Candidatus Cloacimonetes bacterium]|nr:hypothetical protein [Candidatus Cloacimonadota bacterium]
MKKVMLILTLIAALYLLSAQNSVFNNMFSENSSSSSLLNPYKLKMSHSMSFSAGTSSNGLGFYESRYTNHLKYEFSPKLDLAVDLNFVNFGTATSSGGFSFEGNDDNKTKVLPDFSLNYKPSDKISIKVEYKNYRDFNPWFGRTSNWME